MKNNRALQILIALLLTFNSQLLTLNCSASEGMWIMPNVPDTVLNNMEDAGMEFSSDYIYSEKKSSLKDVTVYLSNGYTATIISEKGLMIAPYEAIKLYLPDSVSVENGYTSPSIFKEIPLGSMNAWVLQSTQDVTYRVTQLVEGITDNNERQEKINQITQIIRNSEVVPSNYIATVASTSTGKYFLYTYKRFSDLRLAYMPPASIASDELAKDRHSAHFVLIRLYSDRDNDAAQYDINNKPYNCQSASISRNKYSENDFTMTLGYPNKTNRKALSADLTEYFITVKKAQLKIYEMADSMSYADKKSDIAEINKSIENIESTGVIEKRAADEVEFIVWAANHPDFETCLRYGNVIPFINKLYSERSQYLVKEHYLNELIHTVAPLHFVEMYDAIIGENEEDTFNWINNYFVHFDTYKERRMMYRTLDFLEAEFDSAFIAPVFETERTKFKGDRQKYINELFNKSLITDEKRFVKFLDNPTDQVLREDMLVQLYDKIEKARQMMFIKEHENNDKIKGLSYLYTEGEGKRSSTLKFRPDANYTLRMSYGSIKSYRPDDVTTINAVSTLDGMFNHSYMKQCAVADSLLTALSHTNADAKNLNITFLTDCDMATGRTGYGVYDHNGDLIGMVIGGNDEADNNKFIYSPEYQRLVALDMRYVIFILKNYSKAEYLVKEIKMGEVEKQFAIKEIETPKPVEKPVETESTENENSDR